MNKFLTSAFIFGGLAASAFVSAPVTHATSVKCVSGTTESNLVATITNHDTVTVTTKGGAPLCKDLTLYWSSYTMPDNYDGKAFANGTNKTALPQTQFSNAVLTMKAGSKSASATIALPTCKNVQTDLYYGPEVKSLTTHGHGAAFIKGEVNGHPTNYTGNRAADLSKCQTPTTPATPTTPTTSTTPATPSTPTTPATPVTPSTPVTPTTPTTPVTPVTPETPATPVTPTPLPSTGINEVLTPVLAFAFAAGTYGIARFVAAKRALNA